MSFVLHQVVVHCEIPVPMLSNWLGCGRCPTRNVVLQVLPFDRVISDAIMGPMVLLETRDHERYAFTEGPFASELSAIGVVSRVSERLSLIRTQALSSAESARLIEGMMDRRD
ncbi:hypothetical protein SHIRM173S_11410 [Streptomyces hirsutus]